MIKPASRSTFKCWLMVDCQGSEFNDLTRDAGLFFCQDLHDLKTHRVSQRF